MSRFLAHNVHLMAVPPLKAPVVVHWFRRDLRWHDNRALNEALTSGLPVLPLFIFDPNILERLDSKDDARVTFLHRTLGEMNQKARDLESGILVVHATPLEALQSLVNSGMVQAVYANEDYEPYAQERDGGIRNLLESSGVDFFTCTDHVVQAPGEVMKPDGKPYTVFTPFSKRWHANLSEDNLRESPSQNHLANLLHWSAPDMPELEDLGFVTSTLAFPPSRVNVDVVKRYADTRDIPSVAGTSRISLHLRFGTLSVREVAKVGFKHSDKWLTELIWRDFYQAIMHAFPHSMTQAFKPQYDRVPWRHDDSHFEAWKEGKTGYPLVDAGMRELLATGFMHNRVRMVVASFLCKHLLLDWRLGERHFAAHLLDFELASNVGGWQWAAGSGCDAAPYFRVFNPTSQLSKFDPDYAYVKRWVPEWGTPAYPDPIVDHKMARQRAIDTYKAALT